MRGIQAVYQACKLCNRPTPIVWFDKHFNKEIFDNDDYRKHMNMHSKVKEQCDVCNKTFTNIKQHKKIFEVIDCNGL